MNGAVGQSAPAVSGLKNHGTWVITPTTGGSSGKQSPLGWTSQPQSRTFCPLLKIGAAIEISQGAGMDSVTENPCLQNRVPCALPSPVPLNPRNEPSRPVTCTSPGQKPPAAGGRIGDLLQLGGTNRVGHTQYPCGTSHDHQSSGYAGTRWSTRSHKYPP